MCPLAMRLVERDIGICVVQNILNPCDKDTIHPRLGSEDARESPRRPTFLECTTCTDHWVVAEDNRTSRSDIEYRPVKDTNGGASEEKAAFRSKTTLEVVHSYLVLGEAPRGLSAVHRHLGYFRPCRIHHRVESSVAFWLSMKSSVALEEEDVSSRQLASVIPSVICSSGLSTYDT